jgi:hypothetical protein
VDRTWADDDEQAWIAAGEYLANLIAGREDSERSAVGDGQLFLKKYRRKNDFSPFDT